MKYPILSFTFLLLLWPSFLFAADKVTLLLENETNLTVNVGKREMPEQSVIIQGPNELQRNETALINLLPPSMFWGKTAITSTIVTVTLGQINDRYYGCRLKLPVLVLALSSESQIMINPHESIELINNQFICDYVQLSDNLLELRFIESPA